MNKKDKKVKKMTLEEIKKELGYDFVIVTEHSKKVRLSEKKPGDRFQGPDGREWVLVTVEDAGITAIPTEFVFEHEQFDSACNNNFAKSDLLQNLNNDLLPEIGEENLNEFYVDLTSLDGLNDYGVLRTKISLMTYKFYIEHQDVIAPVLKGLNSWAWLATPFSTTKREIKHGILCVTPQGYVDWYGCFNRYGVLPLCLFKRDILVY